MIYTARHLLVSLRSDLDYVFAADTSAIQEQWTTRTPSAGHCAVVAILVRYLFGGDFVSTTIDGASHWFSRVPLEGIGHDMDVTGDQFGRPRIQIALMGGLYETARVRSIDDVNAGTWERYRTLTKRLEDYNKANAPPRKAGR